MCWVSLPNGLRYLRVGGRGLCLGAEKTRSQKNACKPRRLPHVRCTLCWAAVDWKTRYCFKGQQFLRWIHLHILLVESHHSRSSFDMNMFLRVLMRSTCHAFFPLLKPKSGFSLRISISMNFSNRLCRVSGFFAVVNP